MERKIDVQSLLERCAARANDLSLERFKDRLEEVLISRCGLN
jgi:hypothetical protein